MIIANKQNDSQLMALAPSIKKQMSEWQIVNVHVTKDSPLSQKEIMSHLCEQYNYYEGIIYPTSPLKIVMLIRLGLLENYSIMKNDIEHKMPGHCCRILIRKMSAIGLKQIQIELTMRNPALEFKESMHSKRANRRENVFLMADDDSFVRKSMSALLSSCGHINEVENAQAVLKAYIKYNPDILLLDIHMPGLSGLDIIPSILEIDPDAFILVLSADSQKDNVLKALELGAVGFLSKPPSKERVQEYLGQCITIK